MKSLFYLAAFVLAAAAFAQPRFEVASVKPSPPGEKAGSMSGGPLPAGPYNPKGSDPTRIAWSNIRLIRVLQMAYDLPGDRILGPAWLDTEMYDIIAAMPPGTTIADFKLMVQNLLVERFKLAAHRGTREASGYALEIAKGGLKIKSSPTKPEEAAAAAPDDDASKTPNPQRDAALQYMATRTPSFNAMVAINGNGFAIPRPGNANFLPGAGFSVTIVVNGRNRATILNSPMPAIAEFLGNAAQAPVQDQTGVIGTYDVFLEYVPNPPAGAPAIAADPGPGLFDAIQAQLGLKLTPKKIPQEALIIDHLERIPVEN